MFACLLACTGDKHVGIWKYWQKCLFPVCKPQYFANILNIIQELQFAMCDGTLCVYLPRAKIIIATVLTTV
jgi:hypothetical protein